MKITYDELEDRLKTALEKKQNAVKIPPFSDMGDVSSLPSITKSNLFWVIGEGSLLPSRVNKAIVGKGCIFAEKRNDQDHGRRHIKNSIVESGLISGKNTLLSVENSTIDSMWGDGVKLFGTVCDALIVEKALVSSSYLNVVNVQKRLSLLTLAYITHADSDSPLIDGKGTLCAIPESMIKFADEVKLEDVERVIVHSIGDKPAQTISLKGKGMTEAKATSVEAIYRSKTTTLQFLPEHKNAENESTPIPSGFSFT